MRAILKRLLWAVLCLNVWLVLIHLIVNREAGEGRLVSPAGLLVCALLVVAPALVFLPLADLFPAPLYDVEAIVGWATLGFVVVFFTPSEQLTRGQFLAFLIPLTIAIAALMSPLAYAFVRRFRSGGSTPADLLQARRIGYLAALTLVALALLGTFDVLTPFNGTLVVVAAALVESLAVASRRAAPGPP